jgi:hypothetical protein
VVSSDGREGWTAQARLRYVLRTGARGVSKQVLQQWFAPQVADYMRDARLGEFRDVPVVADDATP